MDEDFNFNQENIRAAGQSFTNIVKQIGGSQSAEQQREMVPVLMELSESGSWRSITQI